MARIIEHTNSHYAALPTLIMQSCVSAAKFNLLDLIKHRFRFAIELSMVNGQVRGHWRIVVMRRIQSHNALISIIIF